MCRKHPVYESQNTQVLVGGILTPQSSPVKAEMEPMTSERTYNTSPFSLHHPNVKHQTYHFLKISIVFISGFAASSRFKPHPA